MDLLILILVMAALLLLAFSVHRAKRAGYAGMVGLLRWLLLMVSRESWVLAEGLAEFERCRHEKRAQWNQSVRLGEAR